MMMMCGCVEVAVKRVKRYLMMIIMMCVDQCDDDEDDVFVHRSR